MEKHLQYVEMKRLERIKLALEKNNVDAFIVQTTSEVVPLVRSLLPKGGVVSSGGSVTLSQCGVIELLKSGEYDYLDRTAPDADVHTLLRRVFSADAYLASANALTEQGEIYFMDGTANRVSAIAFGPASVILVVGRNKIVEDLEQARLRNERVSAPANCRRLSCKTPCATSGTCANCASPERICCSEMVLYQQRVRGRIKVVLVNEPLGY